MILNQKCTPQNPQTSQYLERDTSLTGNCLVNASSTIPSRASYTLPVAMRVAQFQSVFIDSMDLTPSVLFRVR